MKITITETDIRIETEWDDMPLDHVNMIDWSCRLASHEALAWGIKRLSEQLEKSVQFYRTGKHEDDQVSIN